MAKIYCLKQIKAVQGLNSHRSWIDEISGTLITSNDDVLGDNFYIDNNRGENGDTVWFPSPTAAIRSLNHA